jgi:pimeloyl-ACP methyl ester carboxylesterase
VDSRNHFVADSRLVNGHTFTADDGYNLRYEVHGEGPPMLLHHGLVSSRHHWPFFVAHFERTHAVISWDYRGHGGLPAPERLDRISVEGFAADGHAVSVAAGRSPAIVVGLSFGVQVALEHYRTHPEDVRALILLCGTYGHPLDRISRSPRFRRAMAGVLRGFGRTGWMARALIGALANSRVAMELAYWSGGAHRELCPRDLLEGVLRHVATIDPRVFGEVFASYFEHSAADVLDMVRVPTLIVAGDKDQLTPVRVAEEMQRRIPRSRLVVFPGHSHLVQLERPREVHDAVAQFLEEHRLR